MIQIVQYGLKEGHEFYSMDITGFEGAHKAFLEEKLQTIHGYSWLVNLDGSYNPWGEHYLYVKGDPLDILKVIEELVTSTQDSDNPAHSPLFQMVDPDEGSDWKYRTVRQRFAERYPEPQTK